MGQTLSDDYFGGLPTWAHVGQADDMSMDAEEFSTLSQDDKLTVMFSQLRHLRTNTLATVGANTQMIGDHEKRLTRLEAYAPLVIAAAGSVGGILGAVAVKLLGQ